MQPRLRKCRFRRELLEPIPPGCAAALYLVGVKGVVHSQDLMSDTLYQLTINTYIEDPDFNPEPFYGSLNTEFFSSEEEDEWRLIQPIRNPDGVVRVFMHRHGEGEDRHFHLLIVFETVEFEEDEPTKDLLTWDEVIERVSQASTKLDCGLTARAEFEADQWTSLLALPRNASGLVPGLPDDTIMLSGVRLDLRETGLPLDSIYLAANDGNYHVTARYRRVVDLERITGTDLLKEASEITQTFVVHKDE